MALVTAIIGLLAQVVGLAATLNHFHSNALVPVCLTFFLLLFMTTLIELGRAPNVTKKLLYLVGMLAVAGLIAGGMAIRQYKPAETRDRPSLAITGITGSDVGEARFDIYGVAKKLDGQEVSIVTKGRGARDQYYPKFTHCVIGHGHWSCKNVAIGNRVGVYEVDPYVVDPETSRYLLAYLSKEGAGDRRAPYPPGGIKGAGCTLSEPANDAMCP